MSESKKKPQSATRRDPPADFQPKLTAENVTITRLQTKLAEAKTRAYVFDDML
jgi:hypothetical protein